MNHSRNQRMLLGKYAETDINFEGLAQDIGPQTEWGKTKLVSYFRNCVDDIELLEKRRNVIIKLRQYFRNEPQEKKDALRLLEKAKELEAALKESEKSGEEDERLKEYYAQILWEKNSWFAFLNENPWWLEASNIWKVWLLPAMTMIIPLIIIVIPYVVLKITTEAELSVPEYWELLQKILHQNGGQGNMIAGMLIPPWSQPPGTVSQIGQRWMQWCLSIFMFGSSIWQQITLSQHLHKITQDMRIRGQHIIELQDIYLRLSKMVRPVIEKYMDLPDNQRIPGENTLQIFGSVWNNPTLLEGLTTNVGILDVMITTASLKGIGFPTYANTNEFKLERFYHPHMRTMNVKPITNTLELTEKTHSLITGPNRGGKSTSLKGVLANVILAQSLGICFAKSMKFAPFQQIHTALSPSDTLGRLSLFEAEIEFAKEILGHTNKSERCLIVMDEIFHSTNALDGEEASRIFLDKLYAQASVMSLISTHYVKLPEKYAENFVKPLCLHATMGPDSTLKYSYRMRDGINSLSSVREILQERGLLT